MILNEIVNITIGSRNYKYYKDLGYDVKYGETIEVSINDLTPKSKAKIKVKCDYCQIAIMEMKYQDHINKTKIIPKHACKSCYGQKIKEVNMLKYGVETVGELEEIKEKTAQTCYERYGTKAPQQNETIRQKTLNTWMNNYGYEYPSQVPDVKEKIKQSCLKHFGVEYSSQSFEVREKITESFNRNGTKPTSRQQNYLCKLYDGINNFPVKYYNVDICLPSEKIVIEYNGGAHNLQVKLGNITQEDFDKKEIKRNYVIHNEGYKIMQIISSKDYLPSDEKLLEMLDYAKEYFDTGHSWIDFIIDTSTICNSANRNGVFFDYGKLRKITKEEIA